MTAHTPGPWNALPYRHPNCGGRITSYTIEIDETDEYPDTVIGEIYGPGEQHPDIAGNASLIAAAPDLLEALNTCVGAVRRGQIALPDTALQEARAAIEKATGATP